MGGAVSTRTVKRWRVERLSMRGAWASPKKSQQHPATCARIDAVKAADPLGGSDCGRAKSVIIGEDFMIGSTPTYRLL
jgi:hypothetical protein